MLSSVVKSERAVELNFAIMGALALVQMRRMMASHEDLKRKIEEIESNQIRHLLSLAIELPRG